MYGAYILACAEAHDRGFILKQALLSLSPADTFVQSLNVLSRELFDTVTTLHGEGEYFLLQTVQRIRSSFASGYLESLFWKERKGQIPDAMTGRDPDMHLMLNVTTMHGNLTLPIIVISSKTVPHEYETPQYRLGRLRVCK